MVQKIMHNYIELLFKNNASLVIPLLTRRENSELDTDPEFGRGVSFSGLVCVSYVMPVNKHLKNIFSK